MARQDTDKGTQLAGPRLARRRRVITAAAIIAALAAVVVGYLASRTQADLPGRLVPDQGNLHIDTVSTPHEPYNSDPPTSGPHLPYIAPWGIHTRPVAPELQVHNLEDRGVLVQYNCECPDLIARLRGIVDRYESYVILAPYPTMKTRIALTAWTRIEALDDFDARRITRFIEAYRGIDHHK